MRESDVQKKGREKLEKAGWTVIKLIQTTWNGIPDHLLLKKGKTVFIEWKKPGKTVDPEGLQALRHRQLRAQGFEVVVADKTEDIEHLF